MRPAVLNPLFADVTTIKGVGAKSAQLLAKLLRSDGGDARLVDILFHLPSHLIDRRFRCTIAQLPVQGIATLEVTIGKHKAPPRGSRLPYRIEAHDDTGAMSLVFFSSHAEHLARQYPPGEKRFISGEIGWYGAEAQMTHPDYVLNADEFSKLPLLEPVYPLTAGLSSKLLHKAALAALAKFPQLPEWQDDEWLRRKAWPAMGQALAALHQPDAPSALEASAPARLRLAYDELLANQLALLMVRSQMKRASGRRQPGTGKLRQAIIARLPYALTSAQIRSGEEILADMAAPNRMIRLLQGDVGSGKTVVALLALATVIENGAQGAFMVPTEILARQHMASSSKLVEGLDLKVALLTGREKGKARDEVLSALKAGAIDLLIGTHALFQEGVEFYDLGLAVIDEQHRFGVHQRLALQAKSTEATDLLVMTATPIPRTLALTVYGDMDVSRLDEKPPGRKPVDTRVLPLSRLDEVIAGLRRGLASGARAYWVCPLVEESELVDSAAAEQRYETLVSAFPGKVGLIHGRMRGADKDAVMERFKRGDISILVSTTVIEVGVDVPEASIMVIENAERFGLAQLHQLRGRVGRGAAKSSCVLIYQEPLGETAKARLSIMRETEDGFRIAEEDMRLRGAGEVLGTQQSGLALFKMADLSVHGDLLAAARDDAHLVLARDPRLQTPRGEALKNLLYLFERDAAIRLLSSG
jgi:ATP-dependent DNA helicase RecG